MFNEDKIKEALKEYKKCFISKQWPEEKYKWQAVKCFQDNWNVNAEDFSEMLSRSFAKTHNLLASVNNYPAEMIKEFAESAPEEVKSVFIALFDETEDVVKRILEFKEQSGVLLKKYGNGAKQHYQYENAVSTYLWLKHPDKYWIYKFSEVKSVADKLESDFSFKKGSYESNLRNFYSLYDEICEYIKQDKELIDLLSSQLDDSCYDDHNYKTLTIDFCFFVSRFFGNVSNPQSGWWPNENEYSPCITVETWKSLLNDNTVFTQTGLQIMKRFLDYGGQATCTQLSKKYGQTKNFYSNGATWIATKVSEKTGISSMKCDDGSIKNWPVLFVGKKANKDDDGYYIWKLRDELAEALNETDLSNVQLYVSENEVHNYWFLNANPKMWSMSGMPVGETQDYTLYNDNGNKRRIFQNFLDAKAGDIVIGYESTPVKQIVAIMKVNAENDGQKIFFEKIEGLTVPIDFSVIKNCKELEKMEYLTNPQGSLFKLSKNEYEVIMDIIRDENPVSVLESSDKYSKDKFLEEVYMSEAKYDEMAFVLKKKKNIILQGAPGVGKTFAARKLAYSVMGEKDDSRIEFVQFHQNYSYEDFVMGYKPEGDTFELKYGIFYKFCMKAANNPDKDYFFIIDEIIAAI